MNYASQAVQVQVLELLKRVKIWEDLANEEQEQEEEMNLIESLLSLNYCAFQLKQLLENKL